jgi:hypothetical protein
MIFCAICRYIPVKAYILPDASQVLAVQAEPVQPEKKIRRRKMLACTRAAGTGENGADRASELHANIAHPST